MREFEDEQQIITALHESMQAKPINTTTTILGKFEHQAARIFLEATTGGVISTVNFSTPNMVDEDADKLVNIAHHPWSSGIRPFLENVGNDYLTTLSKNATPWERIKAGGSLIIDAALVLPFAEATATSIKAASRGITTAFAETRNVFGFFNSVINESAPQIGQKVYRVWGDEAGPYGRSWTRTNPGDIPDYRNQAGLPNQNTGRFVTEGRLLDVGGVEQRSAIPLHGNVGGLDEILIPQPQAQIEIEGVSGMNPSF